MPLESLPRFPGAVSPGENEQSISPLGSGLSAGTPASGFLGLCLAFMGHPVCRCGSPHSQSAISYLGGQETSTSPASSGSWVQAGVPAARMSLSPEGGLDLGLL